MTGDLFAAAVNARALEARSLAGGGWTVSEVNAAARQMLETSLPPLWVVGEIGGFKRLAKGHCFFALKDARAQIRCVMWRDDTLRLPTEPPEGMEVRVFGYLTVYEKGGDFQLVVRELEARGPGLWRLAFDRLRKKLAAEGLLDPARKRALPPFPRAVGVVTSLEGAALHDIVTVIRRRAPWVDVVVRATRVQGDGAAEEVAAAIRALGGSRAIEVLIVGRGGGSAEDLWAFNDERIARALAESPVPTISAVGHEVDVTIADLVADRRAPTPSAAAESAVPDRLGLGRELGMCRERMTQMMRRRYRDARTEIEQVGRGLDRAYGDVLADRRARAQALFDRLSALSPLAVLKRGYAVPLDEAGHVLRGVEAFRPGLRFTLRVHGGRVRSTAEGVDAEGKGDGEERR